MRMRGIFFFKNQQQTRTHTHRHTHTHTDTHTHTEEGLICQFISSNTLMHFGRDSRKIMQYFYYFLSVIKVILFLNYV